MYYSTTLYPMATNQLPALLPSCVTTNKGKHKELGGVGSVSCESFKFTFLLVPLQVISFQMAIGKGLQYKYEGQ